VTPPPMMTNVSALMAPLSTNTGPNFYPSAVGTGGGHA
jgi:hypothetical protein